MYNSILRIIKCQEHKNQDKNIIHLKENHGILKILYETKEKHLIPNVERFYIKSFRQLYKYLIKWMEKIQHWWLLLTSYES